MLIGWTGAPQDKFDLTNVTFNELKILGTHRFSLPEVEKGIKMLHSHQDNIWKAIVVL